MNLRSRIAAIIDTHTAVGAEGQVTCWCGSGKFDGFHAHSMHAADAVIAALGLRPEKGQRSNATGPLWGSNNRHTVTRYVTEWSADE